MSSRVVETGKFIHLFDDYLLSIYNIIAYSPFYWVDGVSIDDNTLIYPDDVSYDEIGFGLRIWYKVGIDKVMTKDLIVPLSDEKAINLIEEFIELLDKLYLYSAQLAIRKPLDISRDNKIVVRTDPYVRIGNLRINLDEVLSVFKEDGVMIDSMQFYHYSGLLVPYQSFMGDYFKVCDFYYPLEKEDKKEEYDKILEEGVSVVVFELDKIIVGEEVFDRNLNLSLIPAFFLPSEKEEVEKIFAKLAKVLMVEKSTEEEKDSSKKVKH